MIHCYLLVGNTASARIALNRVTPNIDPFLSSTSSAYPFTIAAWDAEKLDLFSNDVSGVDVEVVGLWVQLLVMEGNVQGCLRLIHRCEEEPRVPRRAEILPIIAAVFVSGALASECGEGE